MKCPSCLFPLIVDGQERLESLVEHVCNPNGVASLKDKYICSNKDCLTHSFGACWNEYGETYSLRHHDKSFYVDGNDAPFGSLGRKINVEVYKDDENLNWRLGKFHLELDWKYKADEDGNILSRKPSFKLFINGTLYVSGISMFCFLVSRHYRNRKFRIGDDPRKDFDYPQYAMDKKDWWRCVAPFVLRLIDRSNYLKSIQ